MRAHVCTDLIVVPGLALILTIPSSGSTLSFLSFGKGRGRIHCAKHACRYTFSFGSMACEVRQLVSHKVGRANAFIK